MSRKPPVGLVIDGHIFLEMDQLIEQMKLSRKVAVKSYQKYYRKRIQDWLDEGKDVDVRAEQSYMKQTSRNIGHAIDVIITAIEGIKEQA